MGTSQRHNPSVKGEPNWGKSSTSLTAAIKNLEKLESIEMEDDEPDSRTLNSPQPARRSSTEKQVRKINSSFNRNVRNSVKRLIKASGGKKKVSTGNSRSLGHAGIAVLGNFLNVVSEIQKSGLEEWLKDKGIILEDKSLEEIFNILIEACSDEVVGLDETAANQAIAEIFENLRDMMKESSSSMEDVLQGVLTDQQLQEIIDNFYGVYIFAHLSQNFNEKLEKKYDQEQVDKYMKQIKEQIISDVQQGINGNHSTNVDWNGDEGRKFISDEFSRILNVFDEDED